MGRLRTWLLPVAWLSAFVAGSGVSTGVSQRASPNPASPSSQGAGQVQAAGLDEAAARKLFEEYYAAYEARNVDRTVSYWHTQSGGYPVVQKRLVAFFPLQQYTFSNLLVTRFQSGLDESTARVAVDVAVVTGGPGNKPDRQRWVRNVVLRPDAGVWRIYRESDPIEALVRRLARAKSHDERIGLLAEDPDLVTASLAREIGREGGMTSVRPDQALDWYRLMEQVARRAESPQFIGAAMVGRARVYEALKEPETAMGLYEQALAVFEAANLPDLVGDAEATIGTACLKRLDYPSARDHFRGAATAFRRSGDRAAEAAASYSLGTCHFFEGEWDLALTQYRESLRLQEALLAGEDANAGTLRRRAVASAYQAIGMVEQARGDYDAAVRSLSESLRRYTDLDEPGGTISTRLDLARLRRRQGLPDESLQEYLAAAEVADRAQGASRDLRQIASIDRGIAEFLTHERQYSAAWDYYQHGRDISEPARDLEGVSAALVGMGTLHYVQGRHREALELYARGLAIRESLGDRPAVAWTLVNVGLAQAAQKADRDAIRSFSRSMEIAQELKNTALEAILLTLVAHSHLGLGEPDQALVFARRAVSVATETQDRDVLERAHLIAGAAHRSAGRLDDAAKEIELAMQALEQLRVDRDSGRSDEFFSDQEGPYVAKIELALEQHQLSAAFLWTERLRLRRLRDAVGAAVHRGMTPEERDSEAALVGRVSSLRRQHWRQSRQPNADGTRTVALEKELATATNDYAAQQAALFARYPELRVWRADVAPLTLDDVVKMVPDARTAVLQYLVTEDKTYLFIFTKDDVQAGGAASAPAGAEVLTIEVRASDLIRRVSRFREVVTRPDSKRDSAGRELFDLLLAPASPRLQGRNRLLVLPDAVLWALPFQALQNASGGFLIETHAVEYCASLSALAAVRRLSRAGSNTSAPARNPVAAWGAQLDQPAGTVRGLSGDLAGDSWLRADREAAEVARLSTTGGRALTGKQATREAVLPTQARIVHVATPGRLSDTSPMRSLVLFKAPAGASAAAVSIEVADLTDWDPNAEVVVFSRLREDPTTSGDGVVGLSWAMFCAGARTSVLAAWPVDAPPESLLGVRLVSRLVRATQARTAVDVGGVLRTAIQTLLSDPRYRHPYYWANLRVFSR